MIVNDTTIEIEQTSNGKNVTELLIGRQIRYRYTDTCLYAARGNNYSNEDCPIYES